MQKADENLRSKVVQQHLLGKCLITRIKIKTTYSMFFSAHFVNHYFSNNWLICLSVHLKSFVEIQFLFLDYKSVLHVLILEH